MYLSVVIQIASGIKIHVSTASHSHQRCSINYHHLGAPKTWYGVPGTHAVAFESAVAQNVFHFQSDGKGRDATLELLIQKAVMFPPEMVMKEGVPVFRTEQHAGEFVITFPRSYHAGFSYGMEMGPGCNDPQFCGQIKFAALAIRKVGSQP